MSNGGGQFWFNQFLNTSGTAVVPYSGVKVFHYAAGTTTDKTVWTDETKATPAAQPIIGDSNGIVSFFADGDYHFVVKDSSDNVLSQYDMDNVKITSDTGMMWEGNSGTSLPSATTANRWQPVVLHTANNEIDKLTVNTGTAFVSLQDAIYISWFNNNLSELITHIGANNRTIVIDSPVTLTANVTIPSNITVKNNAEGIVTLGNFNLTINGNYFAGLYKTFDYTGTGVVSFGAGSVVAIFPQWFGAVDDDTFNNEIPFERAITAAPAIGGVVYFTTPAIKWRIDAPVNITRGNIRLTGDGYTSIIVNSVVDQSIGSAMVFVFGVNGADATGIEVDHLKLEDVGVHTGVAKGRSLVQLNGTSTYTISGNVHDNWLAARQVVGVNGSYVRDTSVYNNLIKVDDVVKYGEHGVYFSTGSKRIQIYGNIMIGNANSDGSGVTSNEASDNGIEDIQVFNNFIKGFGNGIQPAADTASFQNRWIIENNIIIDSVSHGLTTFGAKLVDSVIRNNSISGSAGNGFQNDSEMKNCLITGNYCFNNTLNGMRFSNVHGSIISSNLCVDNDSDDTGGAQDGTSGMILQTLCTDNVIANNDCHVSKANLVTGAGGEWTLSASGTSEYYFSGTTLLAQPAFVFGNNKKFVNGSVGSLVAEEWAWADNDSIGINKLYVRLLDSTNPDTKSAYFVNAIEGGKKQRYGFSIGTVGNIRNDIMADNYFGYNRTDRVSVGTSEAADNNMLWQLNDKFDLAFNATLVVDWRKGDVQRLTLTNNVTSVQFTNPFQNKKTVTLLFHNTGTFTVGGWSTVIHFVGGTPPIITQGSAAITVLSFLFDGDGYWELSRSLAMS